MTGKPIVFGRPIGSVIPPFVADEKDGMPWPPPKGKIPPWGWEFGI